MAETALYVYDNVFTHRARAEGEAHGRAEGEIRGRVAIVLRILDRRGIEVTHAARARIAACTDLGQLEVWSDRAVDAATVDDLF